MSDERVWSGLFLGSTLLGPSIEKPEPRLFRKNPQSSRKTLEPNRWKMLWMHESRFPSRSATAK